MRTKSNNEYRKNQIACHLTDDEYEELVTPYIGDISISKVLRDALKLHKKYSKAKQDKIDVEVLSK